MIILGIETSCDDTAVSIVKEGKEILASEILSQSNLHSEAYGGVFPEMASRWHLDAMGIVTKNILQKSSLPWDAIDAIAVTQGPGLIGSLLIGMEFAKGLAWSKNFPLIGVNHLHAHLYAASMNLNEEISFPLLGLVVSGGHTAIFYLESWSSITPIATTRDDALGEAFDKTAKMLSLGYPGGPIIEALAKEGDPAKICFKAGNFKDAPLDFSFSGLKTQVLRLLQENPSSDARFKKDLCASFQEVVFHDVIEKLNLALGLTNTKSVLVGGGVACNQRFQTLLKEKIAANIYLPSPLLSGDNGIMIAGLAYHVPDQILSLDSEPYARVLDKKALFSIPART